MSEAGVRCEVSRRGMSPGVAPTGVDVCLAASEGIHTDIVGCA